MYDAWRALIHGMPHAPTEPNPSHNRCMPDGCNLEQNFDIATQMILDWPFTEQNLWDRATTALGNAGLYTPRDLLVAGAAYVRRARSIGPRAWDQITTNSPLAHAGIRFEPNPTPEHLAHFCSDLSRVSATALLGRIVRFNTEFEATNNDLRALDIVARTVEPGDIRGLFVEPLYSLTSRHNNATVPNDNGRLSTEAMKDVHIESFYRTYGESIDHFATRFNCARRQISEKL